VITRELLDAACESYFLEEPEQPMTLKKRTVEPRRPD
jgi:hypothetical protein